MTEFSKPPNSYKYFDYANKFLSRLWKIFPSLYGVRAQKPEQGVLINPMSNNDEFCTLSRDGIINKYWLGEGAFGEVYTIQIDEDDYSQEIYAIVVSINRQGGYVPFYISVVLKNSRDQTINNVEFSHIRVNAQICTNNEPADFYNLSFYEPMPEIIFGSMLGHLYDLGIGLFYSKFISVFSCDNMSRIIMEKSDYTFNKILKKGNSEHPWRCYIQKDPDILINLIFQLIYAIYVGKKELGFTHFDFHSANAMIILINRSVIDDIYSNPYTYQGENLSTKKYILFEAGIPDQEGNPILIAINNNGLISKIIDYGLCATYLYASENEKFKRPLIISPSAQYLLESSNEQPFIDCANNQSIRNTMEIQYLINHIYSIINKSGIDLADKPIIDQLNFFTREFYDDPQYELEKHFPINKTINYGLDIPNFQNCKELLRGLIRFCERKNNDQGQGQIVNIMDRDYRILCFEEKLNHADYTLENSLIFSESPSENTQQANSVDNFINQMNIIERSCEPGETRIFDKNGNVTHTAVPQDKHDNFCINARAKANKLDPENIMSKKLYSPLKNSPFYDPISSSFVNTPLDSKNNGEFIFQNQLKDRDSTSSLSIFNIQINPAALGMDTQQTGALIYSTHKNWLDLNPILNQPLEIVNLNAVFINPTTDTYGVAVNIDYDIWNSSHLLDDATTGFCINAGYFAISDEKHTRIPIGFMYSDKDIISDINGTYISVPPPYRGSIGGVIWCSHENVMHINTHDIFMEMHETITESSIYQLDDGTLYTTDQPVIKMENGKNIGGRPIMRDKTRNLPYRWALSSGPILVYEGKVVFEQTISNRVFEVLETKTKKLTGYRLDIDQTDEKYDAHDVMAITKSGNIIFFMIEGRGFNAPGLDRVQMAHLINKFDIVSAISLGSGFNSNAVYKIDGKPKTIMQNNPILPSLSFSMIFKFGGDDLPNRPEKVGYTE
jgi:hypothetical protein